MALSPFSLLYHHHHHPFPELSQTDTLSLLKSHAPSLPQPWPHHLLPVSVGFDPLCACLCATSVQSCQTLCDPMDCSPPGSLVHGTLQARILEMGPNHHTSCIQVQSCHLCWIESICPWHSYIDLSQGITSNLQQQKNVIEN